MNSMRFTMLRRGLLSATAAASAMLMAGQAAAQEIGRSSTGDGSDHSPEVIVNNNLNPNTAAPGGALDLSGVTVGLATGVNGIGQMTVRPDPNTTGLSVCSGTLINPRTVIFAAHCVNSRPASAYGPNGTASGLNPNGTPIAFGFGANNLPAVRQWLGLASVAGGTDANPALINATNALRALYAVEQVWYDPRSLQVGPGLNFLEGDVAIATLDTPAFDVPTWAMLFSPLSESAHVTVTGYGVNGSSLTAQGPGGPCGSCATLGAIDFRRRAAENMVVLLSLDDADDFLFGENGGLSQSLYQTDFDNPAGEVGFNFDIYNGAALPREGTTAGGDSGGPLVVDLAYDRSVIAGVLSGGSRFFGQQRFATYGTTSFYQPLFLFWDVIVANNPYVYAGNKAGNGAWEDPGHWVQLMDPAYLVDRGGDLVNDTPDTPALGVSGDTVKFGEICFFDDCVDAADDDTATPPPVGSGTGLQIAGGPGSVNFVPNNVISNPENGIRGRYYDVTLAAPGTTTLGSSITIDLLTVNGPTKLDIGAAGSLRALGDFTQIQGWTNIDGTLRAGEALFVSGLLSGNGTLRAPFSTVVGAVVAPGGGDRIGTLTVDGNLILASASALFVDVRRGAGDLLAVTGILDLNGGAIVFNKLTDGAAPRHGDQWTIATAAGGVDGKFGTTFSFQGVLRPELTYNANSIVATLRAGSLVTILQGQNATAIAFANALDKLRNGFYDSLYGLYGFIDLMDGPTLSMTLSGLAPTITAESRSLQERQSRVMLNSITDRLSVLGTGPTGVMSVNGSDVLATALATGMAPASLSFQGIVPSGQSVNSLPQGMTGFINSGYIESGSSIGDGRLGADGGQRGWYASMGLEIEAAPGLTIGTAFGYADGLSTPSPADRAESRVNQLAAYGSYRLGRRGYVAGLAAAEMSRTSMQRLTVTGDLAFDLYGATEAARYNVMVEAGANLALGRGLTVTPRAALAYSSYELGGFRESGGEAALVLDDLRLQQLEARVGARLGGEARFGRWALQPAVQVDWVNVVAGADDGMSVRFANIPDFAFVLPIAGGDRSWAEVRGGVQLTRGSVSFGAGVESSLGRADVRDDRAVADFTLRF